MIKSLHISNYALIDEIDIEFAPGFNIITGETGAGKSIILGALTLLLGGRADTRVVRKTDCKSVIEGVFSTIGHPQVDAMIAKMQLDAPVEGECLLRREILPGGRSRAFINDTPVNLQQLRDIAQNLVDIHSQHENQLLATPEYQLAIIDSLASTRELIDKYRKAYAVFRTALKKYTETRDMLRRSREDVDFLAFQYEQLEAMHLRPGERAALEAEREILANVSKIKDSITSVVEPLANAQANALKLLSKACSALENIDDTLAENTPEVDFSALLERLESARIEINDIADTLLEVDSNIGADPERLEEVEERLAQLYSLELKHHVDSTDALIELRDRLEQQISALDDADNILASLETSAKRAKRAAAQLADELSARRAESANEFAQELRNRATPLGMPNLRCDISITKDKLSANGCDQVQFLFAFNKNQSLLPIGNTASGGEISRLMLTIKSIVAERMQLPSVIFDEVDTGVSGDVAGRMGLMMRDMSRHQQVITITHLPGVAALGDQHFKVFKEDDENSTNTRIRVLTPDMREKELALMISGNPSDPAALANAKALLERRNKNT